MSFFDDTEIFKFSGSLYVLNDDYIKLNTEKCKLEEEIEQYKKGLKAIKSHIEISGGSMAEYSGTYRIACKYLKKPCLTESGNKKEK